MIEVRFSCSLCHLKQCIAFVRYRDGKETLEEYLHTVRRVVADRHQEISNGCLSRTVDLKLPADCTKPSGS